MNLRLTNLRNMAHLSLVATLSMLALPFQANHAQAQTPTRTLNGIEVSGRFLEEWGRQGNDQNSVYVNGLPITPRRPEISTDDGKVYETQWFERARYEAHPENRRPHDVLLGRLGASDAEGRGKLDAVTGKVASPADAPFVGIDKPLDADGKAKLWFAETQHTLSGKLREYWQRYGGLQQFGFPLSEPFEERSRADGKLYTVQYFERNRMELHPEKPAPYEVELGLLGVEQRTMRAVPGDELPVAPPPNVTSAKDIFRAGLSQEPSSLTFTDDTYVGERVRSLIEDGLVGRDDNDNLFPLNAWYVPTLENGGARFVGEGEDRHLVVKYKIRQGIKWSDGRELTSNDALFAYKLMSNLESPTPPNVRAELGRLQNVDNPDKHTVIYRYRSLRQARDFYNSLPNKENYLYMQAAIELQKPIISHSYSEIGHILPEHALRDFAPSFIPNSAFARQPIGTGPYKVERWTTGQELVLVPNEQYSLTAKPLIKRLELKFITNVQTLEAQLKTGNVDMFGSEAYAIPPADSAGIEFSGGRIVSRPGNTWEHLDFSFDYAPFKERAVREAIFTAINRQNLVSTVFRGASRVMNSVVPDGVYFSLENPDFARNYPEVAAKHKLPIYSYNPARARQLLDEAGWVVRADGIRAKGGIKLQFEYGTTINVVRQQIQGLVQADLKAVGIDAQVKAYPASVFFGSPGPLDTGETKLAQYSYVTSRGGSFGAWRCPFPSSPERGNSTCNFQRYSNAQLEIAATKFEATLSSDMIEAAAEAQTAIMGDIAVIPLVQRANIEVVTAKLMNHKVTNNLTSSFWNARQWYFSR